MIRMIRTIVKGDRPDPVDLPRGDKEDPFKLPGGARFWEPCCHVLMVLRGAKDGLVRCCHRCGRIEEGGVVRIRNVWTGGRSLVEPPKAEVMAAFEIPSLQEVPGGVLPVTKGGFSWNRPSKAIVDALIGGAEWPLPVIRKCRCHRMPVLLVGTYRPHPHVVSYLLACRNGKAPCTSASAHVLGCNARPTLLLHSLIEDWNARFSEDTQWWDHYCGYPSYEPLSGGA
jgi:hypothetical protein